MPDGRPGIRRCLAGTADLLLVTALTVLMLSLALGSGSLPGPLRVGLGFLFVFFVPGYAITAALFPGFAGDRPDGHGPAESPPTDGQSVLTERLVVPVGLSLATVPVVAVLVNFSALSVDRTAVLGGVGAVTILFAAVAGVRRYRARTLGAVAPALASPLRTAATGLVRTGKSGPSPAAVAAALFVVSVAVTGGLFLGQQDGETYTEFSLLTTDAETGNLTADDYVTSVADGETRTLRVGIRNREGRTVNYSVVVQRQRVSADGGERRVVSATELDRASVTVGANRTAVWPYELSTAPTARQQRVGFLLYRGPPPADPVPANAYRQTYLWIGDSAA